MASCHCQTVRGFPSRETVGLQKFPTQKVVRKCMPRVTNLAHSVCYCLCIFSPWMLTSETLINSVQQAWRARVAKSVRQFSLMRWHNVRPTEEMYWTCASDFSAPSSRNTFRSDKYFASCAQVAFWHARRSSWKVSFVVSDFNQNWNLHIKLQYDIPMSILWNSIQRL
jgi:hypothetical protein